MLLAGKPIFHGEDILVKGYPIVKELRRTRRYLSEMLYSGLLLQLLILEQLQFIL